MVVVESLTLAGVVATAAATAAIAFQGRKRPAAVSLLGTPTTYAAKVQHDKSIKLRLPLVFQNAGSVAGVVRALRLCSQVMGGGVRLEWWSLPMDGSSYESGYRFASPFIVPGGSTTTLNPEFRAAIGTPIGMGRYDIVVEAKLNDSDEWVGVGVFDLVVTPVEHGRLEEWHVHRNRTDD